jgi:hypothetical protein
MRAIYRLFVMLMMIYAAYAPVDIDMTIAVIASQYPRVVTLRLHPYNRKRKRFSL